MASITNIVVSQLLVLLSVRLVTPLKCFSCNSMFNDCFSPSTCDGRACTSVADTTGGTMFRQCESADIGWRGCRYVAWHGVQTYACSCDTDYCNGPSTGVQPAATPAPLQVAIVRSTSVTCYRCSSADDDCGEPSTCVGASCSSRVSNGGRFVIRQCEAVSYPDECTDLVLQGSSSRLCTCGADFCNGSGVISAASAGIVVGHALFVVVITAQ